MRHPTPTTTRLRRAPRAASTNVGSPAELVATVHDRCARSAGGSTATSVGSKNRTGKVRVATVCSEPGSSVPATRRPRSSMIAKDVALHVAGDVRDLLQNVVEIVIAGPLEIHGDTEHTVEPFPRHALVRKERDDLIAGPRRSTCRRPSNGGARRRPIPPAAAALRVPADDAGLRRDTRRLRRRAVIHAGSRSVRANITVPPLDGVQPKKNSGYG